MKGVVAVGRRQRIQQALVRLSDGDRTAMPALFDELWPVVLAFARRLTGDSRAEDVAQEAFVKLCAQATDFDRSRDALTWALHLTRYEALTERQRVRRRAEAGPVPIERRDGAAGPDDELEARQVVAALDEALAQLDPAERAALLDEPLGAMPPAVRKRRQRALQRLRLLWRSIHGDA